MRAFIICPAPPKIISCQSRQTNISISSIFVFQTIQQVPWHRVDNFRAGWITPATTTRFCCSTPRMRRYISDPEIPHSIFEIPGARECAMEFRSFSKNGGFTGVRCGFTVMPKTVLARTGDGRRLPLHPLWQRRWSTKSNSVSYPVQRGAEALYSAEGRKQVRALIDYYMGNAKLLRDAAADAGLAAFGGLNAPYIWVQTPERLTSWEMFDRMLRQLNVVITPGAGFGAQGEGYFRISAFNSRENAKEVARRLKTLQSS